jgi:hypothetical protein
MLGEALRMRSWFHENNSNLLRLPVTFWPIAPPGDNNKNFFLRKSNSACQIYKTHESSWFLGNKIVKNRFAPKKLHNLLKIGQIAKMKNMSGCISWRCQKTEFEWNPFSGCEMCSANGRRRRCRRRRTPPRDCIGSPNGEPNSIYTDLGGVLHPFSPTTDATTWLHRVTKRRAK